VRQFDETKLCLGDSSVVVTDVQRELLNHQLVDDGLVLRLQLVLLVRDLLK